MTPPSKPRVSRWRVALPVALFALLSAPLAAWALKIKEPADFQEMRPTAVWPEWKTIPFARWPAAYETWLNDHFPLRARLVQGHGQVKHRWLGAPSQNVVVGRDDWLFYSGNGTLEDLHGRDPLSAAELTRWSDVLEGRRAWLRQRGIAYLFVIAPNKSTIYPDKMPAVLRAQARPGKLDQLLKHLHATSTVPVLDLRPALLARKAHGPVYWPTDSHWNGDGLVAASDAIMTRLKSLGAAQRARDEAAWLHIEQVPRNGDCVELIAMRGHWPQPRVPVLRVQFPPDLHTTVSPLTALAPWKDEPGWKQPIATDRDSGTGRALLLCDSFFRVGGQAEWLAQNPLILSFHRVVTLWEWASFDMIATAVAQEHPDVVIEQWTERFLKTIPEDDPEFARARHPPR